MSDVKRSVPPLVFVISDDMSPGGTQRQIVELLKGIKRNKRFRAILAILSCGDVLETEVTPFVETVLPIQRRSRFDITPAFALLRHVGASGAAIVHTFGWISGLVGLLVARSWHLPVINSGIRAAPPQLSMREKINRWTMRHADVIVSNSQAGLRAYDLAQYPCARVINNGLDLKRFKTVVPRHGINPKVCMVANFVHYKDHPTVIRAMSIVLQTFPNARLTLVGHNLGTLAKNRRLVADLGLTSAVEFITNTTRPDPYVAGSDVCVLASTQNESLSNAILEYMALGKPVVATTCEGNAELIQEGKNGFLVPSHSPKKLAERVIELLQTPAQAQQMGEIGRRRVAREFSLEKMVQGYERLYYEFFERNQKKS